MDPDVSIRGRSGGSLPPARGWPVPDDRRARYSVRTVAAYTHVGKGYSGHGHRGAGRAPAGSTSGRRGAAGTVTKKVRRGLGRLNRAIQVRDALGKRRREWDNVQVWDFVRTGMGRRMSSRSCR